MTVQPLILEGLHGAMEIARPAPGIVILTISGNDVGEFGDLPFRELTRELKKCRSKRLLDLYVDARETNGATINVSAEWAVWLFHHRAELRQVTMLTGSRFIQVTANFVRRFAGMGGAMTVTSDATSFEAILAKAIFYASSEKT